MDHPRAPDAADDVALMEGYHSPQVDVAVRLNTNESPVPPPAAFRGALADELADLDWHRYPDREPPPSCGRRSARCTASGPSRCSRPTGRTRCSRRSASPTAGRSLGRGVRAHLRAARAHRPHHRHRGGRGRAHRRLRPRPRRGATGCSATRPADHVPLLAEQPDPAWSSREAVVEAVLEQAPGLVVVGRGLRAVRALVGSSSVDEDVPLVVTRTYSKTWSMAAARSATSSARRGWSPSSRRSCCRTTSTRSPRPPGDSPALHRRDGGAGGRAGRGAGRR